MPEPAENRQLIVDTATVGSYELDSKVLLRDAMLYPYDLESPVWR